MAETKELSVEGLKKDFGLTDRQAKVLLQWIVAKRTRDVVKTPESAEALFQAQHELKETGVFPQHDARMAILKKVTAEFIG